MKRMLVGKLIVLFLTLLVSHALAADDVIYGCYKSKNKSGSELRIVSGPSQCKRGETSVTLCTKCGGTDYGYKYKVYDADNHYLGLSNDKYLPGGLIYVPNLDKTLPLMAEGDQQGAEIFQTGAIYYENEDCTGQPYMTMGSVMGGAVILPAQDGEIRIQRFVYEGDTKYYFGANPHYVEAKSYLTPGLASPPGCYPVSKRELLWEATEIPESDIPFTLPVALPLHYEANN